MKSEKHREQHVSFAIRKSSEKHWKQMLR
jgi:hypothetical protein